MALSTANHSKEADFEKVIFEMFYSRIYKTAYFIVQDEYLAQDIVQEVFLKAFQSIDQVKDGNKLGAWLGTIATRTAIDFTRSKKNQNEIPTKDVYIEERVSNDQLKFSSVEEIVEEKFIQDMVQQQIANLKPEFKEVLVLKYEYHLKETEISAALEISQGAVKSRLHRARMLLKTSLLSR